MQRRWTEKNVDLTVLSQSIVSFFEEKGFMTERVDSAKEHEIIFTSRRMLGSLKDRPRVRITGDSNDFTVDIVASELTMASIRLGLFTKFIGGGYFALKGIRLKEKLEKMENEFWAFTEEKVFSLSESAKNL